MGKAENSRSRMVHLSRGQLDVSTASPCKHLTLQNPRLTANEMTASQKCDLKQTHASEGAMKFCANHPGRDNVKFQAPASARGLPKHSWNQPANDQWSNNRSWAQFHGIKRSKTVVRMTFIARTRWCRAIHCGQHYCQGLQNARQKEISNKKWG